MSHLIDKLAERVIQDAIDKGQLTDLPGQGQPLELDDETFVPESLRMGYRVLKNAGFLPPELEQRKQAVELCDLLNGMSHQDAAFAQAQHKLNQLELKLRIKGMDTQFIHRYLRKMAD